MPASSNSGEVGIARTRGEYPQVMDKAMEEAAPAGPSEWRSGTISGHSRSGRTRPSTQLQVIGRNNV